MLQSPLKQTRYLDAEIASSVPVLVSCIPMTSQSFAAQVLSKVSMWPIPLTPSTAAVRTLNVQNVSSFEPRPRPGGLVFLADGFPLRPLPLSLFSSKCPSPFTQFQVFPTQVLASFFRRVGCGNPTTPRLLHYRHCCLLVCVLRAFLISSLRVPRFPRRRCPNFATAGMVAVGNNFALLGFIATTRCCWQACTVSIDEFSHQSMS